MFHDCTAYSCFLTVQLESIATYTIFGHDCTVHAVSLQCTCHILLAAGSSFTHFILYHFIPFYTLQSGVWSQL